MLKTQKYRIAFLVWMGLVTWASLATFPEEDTPDLGIPHFDKLVHFGFYFGAAVLGTLYVREAMHDSPPLTRTLIYVALGTIIYGIIIEVLQHILTVDRQADIFDVVANSLGAIIGVWVLNKLFSSPKGLKWKK
ncbi:VanZ family protein [Pricia sp. S334]|uniref:VanZ family protein n=1 Tax=Pricia mediterranea TaxID=3076079 RepID=A0ABU3L8H8_9FLAO|nr:VanZ family protein [Pricia sp. S334]MDT7829523.1 VanZ family protein [Pricia sp. S334]